MPVFRDPPPPSPRGDEGHSGRIQGLHQNCHLAPSALHHEKYSNLHSPNVHPCHGENDRSSPKEGEQQSTLPPQMTTAGSNKSHVIPSIELHPVTLSDAEPLATLFERCFTTDALRLAAKPPHLINPSDPLEERRWRIAQYQLGLKIPTCHIVKAIDVQDGGKIVGAAGFFGPGGLQWMIKGNGRQGGPGDLGVATPSHWDMKMRVVIDELEEEEREHVLCGDYNIWELSQIFIAPEYQKKGIGRLLVEWGVKQANEEGYPVYVEATPDAKRFYEKMGFEVRGNVTIPGVACASGELYTKYSMVRAMRGA